MGQEVYQCEECGFQYAEKEWAEKCEAWCKEHRSCNIEITAHAVSPGGDEGKREPESGGKEFLTRLFYGLMGTVASLAFLLLLYWALRIDSAITNVITNTYDTPLYFWPYVLLTFGTIALFGMNVSLLVYRWRKFGPPRIKGQAGAGGGTLVGIGASACPVCGSTILAAIGIAGGLAAFPLQGLELKALSFGLMALPVWLMRRDLKKLHGFDRFDRLTAGKLTTGGTCPVPKDHRFKESDRPWLTALLVAVAVMAWIGWEALKTEPIITRALAGNTVINPNDNRLNQANISSAGNAPFDEVAAKVLPERGFPSRITLGDSIVKLVGYGVIDGGKFSALYQDRAASSEASLAPSGRGDLPLELKDVLDKPSTKPILLTRQNANYYVNLLWPLGLSNYMSSNRLSPINGKSLFNLASTGGWDLGKEENGGAYFNRFRIVALTPEQEALVVKIAENSYRPCCNNSTFYQDCNHGSALLGLLELGAAQGLSEDELWREALAFNSFWFPHNYLQTALYFKAVKGIDWADVNPREVMGKNFSSSGGWYANVDSEIKRLGLLPPADDGLSCGV